MKWELRAAEYIRMSTEYQQYSTENQKAAIREYAAIRDIAVVRSYVDEGRSGLRLRGRDALQRLLADVTTGAADYGIILVYDVSRWGRFQDADEAAHYEFVCRQAGIRVVYCAELFENDGSPLASIIKGLKRIMAGEYSRELSEKVFQGQMRLASMGYRVGARAGYGLRRVLLDETGRVKTVLDFGERKSLQTDRVVLAPGPEHEVAVVRQIFHWFVHDRLLYWQIIERLNAASVAPPPGVRWSKHVLRTLLGNEKYIGNLVYNRVATRLDAPRRQNPEVKWVRVDGAFPALVSNEIFFEARRLLRNNPKKKFPEEMLAALAGLYCEKGRLSAQLVDTSDGVPSSSTYKAVFGSLDAAYTLVGYVPPVSFGQSARRAWTNRRYLATCLTELRQHLAASGVPTRCAGPQRATTLLGVTVALTAATTRTRSRRRFALPTDADLFVAVPPLSDQDGIWFVGAVAELARSSVDYDERRPSARLGSLICTPEEVIPRLVTLLSQSKIGKASHR